MMGKKKRMMLNVLRWIAVLPASVVGIFLAKWINNFGWSSYIHRGDYYDGLPFYLDLVTHITSGLLEGAAWVFCGVYVAPAYKRVVGVVLCIFTMVVFVFNIYFIFKENAALSFKLISELAYIIAFAISDIVTCVYCPTEEKDKRTM